MLQLVEEGALALDGEVDLIDGGVTVRQLLNHTSGLPHALELDELLEPYRKNPAHRWELAPRDALTLIENKSPLFAPGEGWFYSGSNYIVLGLIVPPGPPPPPPPEPGSADETLFSRRFLYNVRTPYPARPLGDPRLKSGFSECVIIFQEHSQR